jgi:hypothetical protein
VFGLEEANDLVKQYGFNIEFVNPRFVQVMLDSSPAVRIAAQQCADAKYSPDAIAKLRSVINTEFKQRVIPEMTARFKKVSKMVAEFYAARIAHLQTFGNDEDEN